jgi:hypothetical protein
MADEQERIYSYKVYDRKRKIFVSRKVKDSELEDADYLHFYKALAEVYNESPLGVKQRFLADAMPKMMEFMEKVKAEGVIEANDSLTVAKGLGGDTKTVN